MANNPTHKIERPAKILFTSSRDVVEGTVICENYSPESDMFGLPHFRFMPFENQAEGFIFTPWQVSMITFL